MFTSLVLLVAGSLGVAPYGDRSLTPPEDGRNFATIICVPSGCQDGNCRQATELLGWFRTDERLNSLTRTTAFFVFRPDDALWKARYAPTHAGGVYPTIWVQDYSGGRCMKLSGPQIPNSAKGLADRIAAEFASLPAGWANVLDLDGNKNSFEGYLAGDRQRPFFVPDSSHPKFPLLHWLGGGTLNIVHRALILCAVVFCFGIFVLVLYFRN